MQNKPNLLNAEMNVSKDYTGDYENKYLRRNRKNKPNSNPIQSQFEAKTNPIKPKTNPNQTQFQKQKESRWLKGKDLLLQLRRMTIYVLRFRKAIAPKPRSRSVDELASSYPARPPKIENNNTNSTI